MLPSSTVCVRYVTVSIRFSIEIGDDFDCWSIGPIGFVLFFWSNQRTLLSMLTHYSLHYRGHLPISSYSQPPSYCDWPKSPSHLPISANATQSSSARVQSKHTSHPPSTSNNNHHKQVQTLELTLRTSSLGKYTPQVVRRNIPHPCKNSPFAGSCTARFGEGGETLLPDRNPQRVARWRIAGWILKHHMKKR